MKAAATREMREAKAEITVMSFLNSTFSTNRMAGICAICEIGARLANRPITKLLAPRAKAIPGRKAPVTNITIACEQRPS